MVGFHFLSISFIVLRTTLSNNDSCLDNSLMLRYCLYPSNLLAGDVNSEPITPEVNVRGLADLVHRFRNLGFPSHGDISTCVGMSIHALIGTFTICHLLNRTFMVLFCDRVVAARGIVVLHSCWLVGMMGLQSLLSFLWINILFFHSKIAMDAEVLIAAITTTNENS